MSKITGPSTPLVRATATQQTADTAKIADVVNSSVAANQQITSPTSPYSDKTKANLKAEFATTSNVLRAGLENKLPGTQLSPLPTRSNESMLSEQNPVPRTFTVLDDINEMYNDIAKSMEKEYQKLIQEALNQVPPDTATAAKLQEELDKKLDELEKERQKALAQARNSLEDEAAKRADFKANVSTYGLGNDSNGLVDYSKKTK